MSCLSTKKSELQHKQNKRALFFHISGAPFGSQEWHKWVRYSVLCPQTKCSILSFPVTFVSLRVIAVHVSYQTI
uniref:Uncharacterized protein n=1 Tax=Arundo donax TaxID=35708 RepID=A0A0A9F042_ARUDO